MSKQKQIYELGNDPIQNRRLSRQCWNGHDNHKKCSRWLEGAPPEPCECLCHSAEHRRRVVRSPKSDQTIMDVYGTIQIGPKYKVIGYKGE